MMTWLRRLVWLALACVCLAAVGIAVVAAAGPAWIEREAAARAATHGVTLRLEGLALRRSGDIAVERIAMAHDSGSLQCESILAAVRWRGVIARRTPLDAIIVEQCTFEIGAFGVGAVDASAEQEPPATADPSGVGTLDKVDEAFARLAQLTERVEIATITGTFPGVDDAIRARIPAVAMAGRTGDARLEALRWSPEALEASASVRLAGVPLHATLRYPVGGALRVQFSPWSALGATATLGTVSLQRDAQVAIEQPEVALPFGAGVVRAERVTYRPGAPIPWLVEELQILSRTPRLAADEPLPEASEGVAPDGLESARAGIDLATPWARWQRAHEQVARVLQSVDRIPELPAPVLVRGLTLPDGARLAQVALGAPLVALGADEVTGDGGQVAVWHEGEALHLGVVALPLSAWAPALGHDARLTATAEIRAEGVRVDGELQGAVMVHEAVAQAAVALPTTAWSLAWSPDDAPGTLELRTTWGALASTWAIAPDEDGHVVASWRAEDAWSCEEAWRTLPAALVPTIGHDAIRWEGTVRPSVVLRLDPSAVERLRLEIDGVFHGCEVAWIAPAWDPAQLLEEDWTYRPDASFVSESIELGPGAPEYQPLSALPAYIPAVMYLSEEVNFPTNPGFAEGLIERGMRLNLSRGRYVYGGSSISQQLVKNLFLHREKTLARKVEEAALTLALEAVVPKWRILELYVNCIEFGPDVWGIEAAARHYFGRPAAELSPLEAAFLANLKPAPREGNTYRRRGRSNPTGWWPERLGVLITRLVEDGQFISMKEAERYAPYVVALRMDDAPLDADGYPVLGDGDIVRIPRPSASVEVWSVPRALSGDDSP